VVVLDDLGDPVSGATVFGTFSGDLSESISGDTDATGTVVLTSKAKTQNGVDLGFCVDDVVDDTLVYTPDANLETCDDI
jgi:hypothetical protein